MTIGISSWTYPWAVGVPHYPSPQEPLTILHLLDRAMAFGVGVLQVGDNLPLDELTSAQFQAIRDRARESHIKIEASTRGVEPSHLRMFLSIAKQLDAKLLRTLTHSANSAPDLRQIETYLREVLPEFAAAGVSIGLENYERHTSRELAELIDRIDSPFLGVCLDTVNSLGALETPSQTVDILAPYVINIHVKDFVIERLDTKMGYVVRGCPAGEGMLDLDRLLDRIDRFGRRPHLILEQWPPFVESLERSIALESEWAEQGVRFLERFG